jgi:hypothetical protein
VFSRMSDGGQRPKTSKPVLTESFRRRSCNANIVHKLRANIGSEVLIMKNWKILSIYSAEFKMNYYVKLYFIYIDLYEACIYICMYTYKSRWMEVLFNYYCAR